MKSLEEILKDYLQQTFAFPEENQEKVLEKYPLWKKWQNFLNELLKNHNLNFCRNF